MREPSPESALVIQPQVHRGAQDQISGLLHIAAGLRQAASEHGDDSLEGIALIQRASMREAQAHHLGQTIVPNNIAYARGEGAKINEESGTMSDTRLTAVAVNNRSSETARAAAEAAIPLANSRLIDAHAFDRAAASLRRSPSSQRGGLWEQLTSILGLPTSTESIPQGVLPAAAEQIASQIRNQAGQQISQEALRASAPPMPGVLASHIQQVIDQLHANMERISDEVRAKRLDNVISRPPNIIERLFGHRGPVVVSRIITYDPSPTDPIDLIDSIYADGYRTPEEREEARAILKDGHAHYINGKLVNGR